MPKVFFSLFLMALNCWCKILILNAAASKNMAFHFTMRQFEFKLLHQKKEQLFSQYFPYISFYLMKRNPEYFSQIRSAACTPFYTSSAYIFDRQLFETRKSLTKYLKLLFIVVALAHSQIQNQMWCTYCSLLHLTTCKKPPRYQDK